MAAKVRISVGKIKGFRLFLHDKISEQESAFERWIPARSIYVGRILFYFYHLYGLRFSLVHRMPLILDLRKVNVIQVDTAYGVVV